MAECLLVGRNFVSGICKLKPEKPLKNLKPKKIVKPRFLPAVIRTRRCV